VHHETLCFLTQLAHVDELEKEAWAWHFSCSVIAVGDGFACTSRAVVGCELAQEGATVLSSLLSLPAAPFLFCAGQRCRRVSVTPARQ
jgi:hypothetical protein